MGPWADRGINYQVLSVDMRLRIQEVIRNETLNIFSSIDDIDVLDLFNARMQISTKAAPGEEEEEGGEGRGGEGRRMGAF